MPIHIICHKHLPLQIYAIRDDYFRIGRLFLICAQFPYGGLYMNELSEKEKAVLRSLLENTDRPRKQMALAIGITEPDFSRTVTKLTKGGVIKKYTVELNYKKLGYPDGGIFIFSLSDKKLMRDVVEKLRKYPEIIDIQEVFGAEHDFVVRIMAEDNERIRIICRDIEGWDEVNSNVNTFTLIFGLNYWRQPGFPI